MATYLKLCQDVLDLSGTGQSSSLTSVTTSVGRLSNICRITAMAWRQIQLARNNTWLWMQADWSATLAAGVATYTPDSLGVSRVAEWNTVDPLFCYKQSVGKADEGKLAYLPYEGFRSRYLQGVQLTSRPTYWTVRPEDNAILLNCLPDDAYVLTGRYTKTPQVLVANDDVPEMPSRFHDLIMWRAKSILEKTDVAPVEAAFSDSEYAPLWMDLCASQLPRVTTDRRW